MSQNEIKKFYSIIVALLIFNFSFAQKVAFVNETKLLEAVPGYREALAETDEIKKHYSQEIKEAQDKLQIKVQELLKNYKTDDTTTTEQLENMLSEKDNERYALLKEENELLQKQTLIKQKQYNTAYKDKVGTILEKVNKSVKEYCHKNKIEILYKIDVLQQALAYYDESKDVTEAIIVLVKK